MYDVCSVQSARQFDGAAGRHILSTQFIIKPY